MRIDDYDRLLDSQGARTVSAPPELDTPLAAPLGATTKALLLAVWLWSLFETHWELLHEHDILRIGTVTCAKVVLTVVVFSALRRASVAPVVFAFWCVVSVVAIAVALPDVYSMSRTVFFLSLVEAVFKTVAVIAVAFHFIDDRVVDEEVERWELK